MSIKVAIIEDETMVADMLKAWFSRRPDLQVVGCAADGAAALALCRQQQPDVATLDIQLPGINGLAVADLLLQELPATKIVILSGRQDPYFIARAKQLGVHGYVDKMSPLTHLEKAVRAVAAGGQFFSGAVQQALNDQYRQPDAFNKILTPRERDILGLIATGLSDHEVGAQLKISPETVGTHRRNASRKLNIFNDRKLMQYAREQGLDFSVNQLPAKGTGQPAHRKKTT
jgi:DNA-binding NarL/FixJ family response regulator